jgi:trehalose 6-phosphate phosphatase
MAVGSDAIESLLGPLRSEPEQAAILSDLDGTLAPIVDDPFAAAVPAATRETLRQVCDRYAVVGCITGRRAADARRIVGVDGMLYVGNHGLETLAPGGDETKSAYELGEAEDVASAVVAELAADGLQSAGVTVEDKGPIKALHWRGTPDEARAIEAARAAADRAEAAGLRARWGRKVLELRPAEADKGGAVRGLIDSHEVGLAMFGGDDTTDLDAFAALRDLERTGRLRAAVAIGVASAEAPEGLVAASDVVVPGTEAYLDVLRFLVR